MCETRWLARWVVLIAPGEAILNNVKPQLIFAQLPMVTLEVGLHADLVQALVSPHKTDAQLRSKKVCHAGPV